MVEAVRIPVLANGDIATAKDARRVLAATGAAGVMVGRAALGRPWLFRELRAALEDAAEPAPPTGAEVRGIILGHLEALHGFYGAEHGVRIARKHLAWYARHLPGSPRPPAPLMTAPRAEDQLSLTRGFLDEALGRLAHAA